MSVPERYDSSALPQHYKHYRFNCAGSFQSLASHLTDIMYYRNKPNRHEAVEWVTNCIQAREKDENRRGGIDRNHLIALNILYNLRYAIIEIPLRTRATIEFVEEPGRYRFRVRLEDGRMATANDNGIWYNQQAFGGRKSTRKNRKRNRKTYRILPRVEGS